MGADNQSLWTSVKQVTNALNPLRIRKRHIVLIDAPNSHGISNSTLRSVIEKRGKDATYTLNAKFGSVYELVKLLDSDEEQGLSNRSDVIEAQRSIFGPNSIPPVPPQSLLALCFQALIEPLLLVLLGCAILSIGLSFYQPPGRDTTDTEIDWIEGVAILAAVIIVVLVTGINDWQKDKKFRSLQDKIEGDKEVSVIRDGQLQSIPKADLVVGDIYVFKYGDLLQADGFLIQGSDITIDEASLTGECNLIKKDDRNRTMLSGTSVMEGCGRMIVAAVGVNSQVGIILRLLDESEDQINNPIDQCGRHDESGECTKKKSAQVTKHLSVLQIKLGRLALFIAYAGLVAAFLTFTVLVVRFCVFVYIVHEQPWNNAHISYFVSSLVQAITVIVVAVPEGLPLAVTLALAFAVVRMLKDNNLVRHLNACETMGNATTICSDKTGTLTTNRMTVTQCYIAGKFHKEIETAKRVDRNIINLLGEAISVNTAYSSSLKPSTVLGKLVEQLGNKTECGLLGFVNELGENYETYRQQYPETSFHKVFCFNSARKMMTTVIKRSTGYTVYTKGAPEIVLPKCTALLQEGGNSAALQAAVLSGVNFAVDDMSQHALRTICLAHREIPLDEGSQIDWDDEEAVVNNLTCMCIAGIEDPVRCEVPDAIRKCQRAGVVVRMVTGDNVNTARSIAQQCGIIHPESPFLVLESSEFNERIRDKSGKVSQVLFDEIWPNLRVLARSSPQDKYTLVNGIVESKVSTHREIVAVTGDGTNDAPALKRADVGFAMGIQGTDVAKEACDIILTDDNFTSIVKALMWGRNVYDNIAKFLQFQLTANVSAGLSSVICAAAISRVPLTAIQMLWVNLVMDTLASIALSSERPSEELLERKPYGRTRFIVSPTMLRNILGHSAYQLTVMFVILFAGELFLDIDSMVDMISRDPRIRDPSEQFTVVFNSLVLMILFNEINARKLHSERNVFKGLLSNWIFIVVWLACIVLQALIVSFGGLPFSAVALRPDLWAWCFFFGIGSLVFNQLLVCIPTRPFGRMQDKVSTKVSALRRRRATRLKSDFSLAMLNILDDDPFFTDSDDVDVRDSAILWYRGINRVRVQANAISIFQKQLGFNETIS